MANQSSSTIKKLTTNNLPLLCNTLNPVAPKCFALGLQLGVEEARIRMIITNNRYDCEAQLREIISKRLKQASPLTWLNIVTALRSPTVDENSLASQIEQEYLQQTMVSHQPVRGPSDRGHYRSQSPVRGPSDRGHYRSQSPVRGPSDRGHYRSQSPVRGASDRGHYRSRSPVRVPSDRGHYRSRSPVRGPSDRGHYRSRSPVRGPSDRGHYRSRSPVRGPSDRGHYRSRSPVRGPSDRGHYRSRSPVRGPSDRGPSDRGHYRSRSPVRGPSDRGHYRSRSPVRGPSDRRHYRSRSPVRGPSDRGHYRSRSPVRGPSDRGHYRSRSPVRGPSDRGHYRSQSPVMGPSDRGHYRSQLQIKSPMQQYVDYLKDTYKQSTIERSLDVLKWPPTPSKVFISLACIDRKSDVSKDKADEYTRAMIEDGNIDVVLKKKESIEFADIGKNLLVTNSSERVILVEGAPGVGKSTFAWEFCRRWERGEIAQQYQLVLLLRLRDERMSIAKNLQQLIYHPDIEDISHAVKCELVHNRGVNTLIILEGFDELPDSQRKKSSIYLQLILGQLLMHATIMITSRPWATGEIMRRMEHKIFQHIEVLGFTEENIVKYVRSVFTGEGKKIASAIDQSVGGPDEVSEEAQKNIDDVMAYIGKYPQIKACMYIPLNAAIVVSIYKDSKKGKCILPKTLTELYYALTQILLLRYLYGHADYEEQKWNIDCFEKDLPDEVYKQLLTICKVAYDGICRKGKKRVQLIFSDRDLGGCETLGFMQSVAEVYVKHGRKMSHNFLHLTVQEFLAAFLICTQSPAEQLKEFQRHKDGRLIVVLRFVAGLTKLNKVTPDELRSLLGEPTVEQSDEHQTPYCNPMRPDVCVSAHHTNWLFEAQNSELLQSLFHNHTASFTFTRGMLPLEYYSVGYCIAHSHSKWSLTFDEDTEEEKVSMLLKGADTGDLKQCSVVLKTYTKAIKSMSSENLNLLLTRFSGCVEELYLRVTTPLSLPHLSALRILELSLGGKSDVSDFSLPVLESLTVIGTTKNAIASITKALCKHLSSSSSIVHLHFKSKVNDQSMEEIFQSVCDNIALPLKNLDIDCKCKFTTTATRSLVQFITRSTTLQYLKIHIDTLEDVDILAKGLSNNIALPLKSLDIDCWCTFTTTATRSLVQFITRSTTLQYIRICHVTFSAQGLIELAEAIHHCSGLQEKKLEELLIHVECSEDVVNLRHMIKDHPEYRNSIDWNEVTEINQSKRINESNALTLSMALEYVRVTWLHLSSKSISNVEVEALVPGLYHCSTLKRLDLSYNSISDAGAETLTQALHHNSTLMELYLSNNNISDGGAEALAQALHHNCTLKELYLSNNNISDAGAEALAQALHHNCTLKELYLSNNNISDAGAEALAQALHHNCTLKELYLSNNNISGAGAEALAQALHHNCTLKELYLSDNNISDAGAVALAQALYHNSTLKELNLNNNNISDSGAVALARALHHNSTLDWLYLSNSNISDGGAVALAQALHHNSTLQWLDLSNNNISDAGAVALAQALHHNSTLKNLDLSNNNINDAGAVALAQTLHHNSTLERLHLYGNVTIGKEGTHQLVQALTVNTSITKATPYGGDGLILPRRCKEYATQCTQYNTVKDRVKYNESSPFFSFTSIKNFR